MRARAVRMVPEHQGSCETPSAAVSAIAPKIGCIPETLKVWVRQAERDSEARDGATMPSATRSKSWNERFDSCGKRTGYCARASHPWRHWFRPNVERANCAQKVRLLLASGQLLCNCLPDNGCTIAGLMAGMGLRGIVRGKAVKTTIPDVSVPCPRDKVNRQFRALAPSML